MLFKYIPKAFKHENTYLHSSNQIKNIKIPHLERKALNTTIEPRTTYILFVLRRVMPELD